MTDHAVLRTPLITLAQSVIGWATLSLILIVVVFFGGNSPVYWTLLGFAVFALFMLQTVLTFVRGGHWTNRRLVVPACLYLAVLTWGVLQTMPGMPVAWTHPFWRVSTDGAATISATPIAGSHSVLRLATYAMVFWIALQASMNANRALWFLRAFAVFSSALALFGLFAALSGVNIVLGEQASSSVSATFVNRNSYALYAAFGLLVNLGVYSSMIRSTGMVHGSRKSAVRGLIERFFSGAWVFLFGAVICLSALLLTASRAGVASGLVATLILVLLLQRKVTGSRAIWLVATLVLGAFLTVLSENVLARLSGGAGEERFIIYREMLANIGDRLMLGHGLGAFQDTFREHVPLEAARAEWSFAHSSYLENLWEMGLPATLAFYGALIWIAAVILRGALLRNRNRVFSVVALASLVAGGLHSLVDFSLQMPATTAVFAFILGIGWAHAWPRQSGQKEPGQAV